MTGLIRPLPLFDCVYLSLSWMLSSSWVYVFFLPYFSSPANPVMPCKAFLKEHCAHSLSSQHLAEFRWGVNDFPGQCRGPLHPLCWQSIPKTYLNSSLWGHSGSETFLLGNLSEVCHLRVFRGRPKEKKVKKAKKARAAAEAAAEQGDSGLAPEAKLEGKKALWSRREEQEI